MQARVHPDCPQNSIRALQGREFIKREWRPVPVGFEAEAEVTLGLEVREDPLPEPVAEPLPLVDAALRFVEPDVIIGDRPTHEPVPELPSEPEPISAEMPEAETHALDAEPEPVEDTPAAAPEAEAEPDKPRGGRRGKAK